MEKLISISQIVGFIIFALLIGVLGFRWLYLSIGYKSLKTKRIMPWFKISVCQNCEETISDSIKMFNSGICPKCGHDARCSVCDTVNVIVRRIKWYHWWFISNREITYQGRNEFSIKWLNDHDYKIKRDE